MWYPTTPSQIQLSIWDGGSSSNKGTSLWAGGPIDWGNQTSYYATYKYVDIQCYDDKDAPVKSWPPQPDTASISAPAGNKTVSGKDVTYVDYKGRTINPSKIITITNLTDVTAKKQAKKQKPLGGKRNPNSSEASNAARSISRISLLILLMSAL